MTNYDRRIEKLEQFMAQLTLTSYIAKAAQTGGRVLGEELSEGDDELTGAVTSDVRFNKIENRMNKIERFTQNLYDELIGAPRAQAGEKEALGVLAKAQGAVQRKGTPEGILERAQRVLTDPTAVGIVEGYVSANQLVKAAELLEQHEKRADHAAEDEAQGRVESQIDAYDQMATVSQLGEQMAAVQEALSNLLSRLARLERPASTPAQEQKVVAKAHGKRQRRQETDYRDSPNGLAERAQGVIDSASLVGQIGSMLQSGDDAQITQARQTIESAELRHESRMKNRDRRSL